MRQCSECGRSFEGRETVCPVDGTILDAPGSTEEQAIGKTLDGKYRIDGFLKRGGMGAVYRGTHLMLNKAVAIKLIKPELVSSNDVVQRFLREARAAAKLSHPNIVTVHDLGQTADGTLYIAMELVDGASLKELIQKEGAWAPSRAIALTRSIAKALALAHRNGIVHRDLKPQNIMVFHDSEGQEVPKLLDFGIAKTFEPTSPALTSTGMVLGTPHYMSAEQAKGQSADARSDLYALGVILYEMLVGKVPFDDDSIPQILIKHLNEEPVPPTRIQQGIPAELESIVLKCLEKDPERRFQRAEELLEALGPLVDTVGTTPPPLPTVAMGPPSVAEASPTRETTMAGAAAAAPTLASIPSVPVSASSSGTLRAHEIAPGEKRSRWPILLVAVVLFGIFAVAAALFLRDRGRPGAEPEATAASQVAATDTPTPPPSNEEPVASSGDEAKAQEPAREDAAAEPPPPPPVSTATPPATPPAQTTSVPPTSTTPPAVVAAPALPRRPALSVDCEGVRDGCAALRFAIAAASRKKGLRPARRPRADVRLDLSIEEVEARQEEQFGTTFVVRTYAVEARGDSPHFEDELILPPRMVTFDARFGREKLEEASRRIASSIVDAVKAYWNEQSGRSR